MTNRKIRSRLSKFLSNPFSIVKRVGEKGFLNWIPDALYLKIVYRAETGKRLDLKHPMTYNEKLQWLKLYDRRPEYTMMVDKYEVRKYVAEKIGEEYLIPLIGVYDSVDEIPWEELPDKFVLKCTHGSGSNIICSNKRKLDIEEAKKKLRKWMKKNWYWFGREWAYKNVRPRIICEKFLLDKANSVPDDYKLMCFNEQVRLIQHHRDRFAQHTLDFFDTSWARVSMTQGVPNSIAPSERPRNLDTMISFAEILAQNTKYSRIDFYYCDGRIYFGEITLYPTSGFTKISPSEYDLVLGELIKLDQLSS